MKSCDGCGRMVSDSFICRRCGRELRELLVGAPPQRDSKSQPGIVWYINRIYETAYRQARLAVAPSGHHKRHGYYLLGDAEALKLLERIYTTLSTWTDVIGVVPPHRLSPRDKAVWQAKALAVSVPVLRHNFQNVASLRADLLTYAKQGWKVINRPDDICCGACTKLVEHKGDSVQCGTILYAEEFAAKVQCPRCTTEYDVSELRQELKRQMADMLFTASELLKLMETRLNDRMPPSTFYLMVSDGRIRPRPRLLDGKIVDMFTYEDVCAAREKPVPGRRRK